MSLIEMVGFGYFNVFLPMDSPDGWEPLEIEKDLETSFEEIVKL